MDVHKEQYTICCYSYETDKVEYKQTIPSDYKLVLRYMEQVRSRYDGEVTFVCGYEAGCLGYSLYHQLKDHAVDCKILAPSTMAVTNTHHVKTNKRDAAFPRDRGMSMLVIGITGPTGCGKTTLLQQIERRGGYIVDCDALYYALLASKEGAALRQELQTAFPDAFDADGSLRRKALGQLVFGDKARMAQLNEIVFFHVGNAVRARLVRERAAGRQLFA